MKQKPDPGLVITVWEWARADLRLDYMEAQARAALRDRRHMASIAVKQEVLPESPIIIPSSGHLGVLVDAQGNPIT